jgi:hypothetical protein
VTVIGPDGSLTRVPFIWTPVDRMLVQRDGAVVVTGENKLARFASRP